jgi:hypothetical protein
MPGGGSPRTIAELQLRRAVDVLRTDCDKQRIIRHLAPEVNQRERGGPHGSQIQRFEAKQPPAGEEAGPREGAAQGQTGRKGPDRQGAQGREAQIRAPSRGRQAPDEVPEGRRATPDEAGQARAQGETEAGTEARTSAGGPARPQASRQTTTAPAASSGRACTKDDRAGASAPSARQPRPSGPATGARSQPPRAPAR